MRPGWLRAAGIAFTEQKLAFNTEAFARGVGEVSPAGLVPVLLDDEFAIWDSLAICEYLADRHPEAGLWPAQPRRAPARSLAAQMHSGFAALRQAMPLNVAAPARRRILRRRPAGHLPDSGSLAGRARAVRPGRTVPVRRLHHRRCVLRASGVALHHLWRQRHRRRARLHGRRAGAPRHAGMDPRLAGRSGRVTATEAR